MKPKADPASTRNQGRLFDNDGPLLSEFIDMKHPLVRMADTMQWETFEAHWRTQFSDAGGPMANSGRRVAGLLMLKHMETVSDERLMALWVTNPYVWSALGLQARSDAGEEKVCDYVSVYSPLPICKVPC